MNLLSHLSRSVKSPNFRSRIPSCFLRRSLVRTTNQSQPHRSSQQEEEKFHDTKADKVLVRVLEQGKTLPHQQWTIRLNVMNGYLSWCRNSYLCLAGFITLTISQYGLIDMPRFMSILSDLEVAAQALLILSQLNLTIGTGEYIYHLLKTKPLTHISTVTTIFYITVAILHLFIFYSVFKVLFTLEEQFDESNDVKNH